MGRLFLFVRELQFANGGANAANDEVGRGLVGSEAEQFDWMIESVGAKDDAIGFVADIAKGHCVGDVHRIDVGPGRLMGHERVVVSVNDGNHSGAEGRLHWAGLGGCDAHGEETLPIAPCKSAAGAKVVQHSGGQTYELDDGPLIDHGRMKCDGLGDERNSRGVVSFSDVLGAS